MKSSLIAFTLLLLLFSCDQKMSKENKNAASEGLKEAEIKKVSSGEIVSKGMEIGKSIADTSQIVLGKTLKRILSTDGTATAIEYCNLNAYRLIDSLSDLYNAEIKRVSLRVRNPQDKPDSLENTILEAYQYSVDNGEVLTNNVQLIDDQYLLFTKPIRIGDPACLQCHGEIGKDIDEATLDLILSKYPNDDATGHQITDLRGMWSIRIPKKEIIKAL